MGDIMKKIRMHLFGETDEDIQEYSDKKKEEENNYRTELLKFLEENANGIAEYRKKEQQRIEEEDSKYPYPIKKSKAEEIANRDDTLKTDFCRNSNRKSVTYLSFNDTSLEVIEKDGKKYWQYQVTEGDISWIEFGKHGNTFCDGWLGGDDFKWLRCLIDVETGEYIYYPQKD